MNSGKYLYKVSTEKKIQNTKKINVRNNNIYKNILLYNYYIIQKPQLKYITNETINHFKKFISKLYKKEEETLLNKKKKREEIKLKNKSEKRVNNKNGSGYNQYNNNYYPGLYIPQIQPINNQNPAIMNDIQYYYYNSSYQFPPQMYGFPPYFNPYFNTPKSLQDSLNNIYQRGIVNNLIGAFFIKEHQEKFKNNEKRKVPISMVELGDEQNSNTNDINENNNINGDNDNINLNMNKNEYNKDKINFINNNKNIIGENNDSNNFYEKKGNNNIKNENNNNRVEEKKGLEENKDEKKKNNLQNNTSQEKELQKPDVIIQLIIKKYINYKNYKFLFYC